MVLLKPAVKQVTPVELTLLCAELADRVRDFDPDLIVGIATGGADIAATMAQTLEGAELVIVKSQRPGTLVKQGRLASRVIAALPEPVANLARWVEVEFREAAHYVRTRRRRADGVPTANRVALTDGGADAVARAARVLVVDDTVDSGQTLCGVVRAVATSNPRAQIRTAVIASTWRRPPVLPDYVLQDRLLLRLPSSFDA